MFEFYKKEENMVFQQDLLVRPWNIKAASKERAEQKVPKQLGIRLGDWT